MKLKNKKRLFATLLASNLLIIPIISAACVDTSKNKKEDFDPQQATLNVKETSKPKNQTYSTQFQKANLQITYQGQTYDFDKDKNGFEFSNNTIVVTNFKPNKANGTLSVTLKYGENTSEFIIDGFKKIKPLDEISIFENDTEISSSLETNNHSEVFASSLTEQQLKESILVDEQKPSNQKFDIIISNVKADDNKGTLSFNAKVSFKESDPLDHQKNISKEISLTNFKTIDPTNSLNKSINRDDFKELRFVFKDQSKNPKAILPSEITNDMLDLQVGKKEIKDGKEQISWSPIDNNLYTWRFTNLKIVDDNKGTLAKEVIISFKENPTVKGRTQRFDAILSGLKTSKEIEHDQSVQPANVAFDYAYETDPSSILLQGLNNLQLNDFRSFQVTSSLKKKKEKQKAKTIFELSSEQLFANRIIEMYSRLYYDGIAGLSWNTAIKEFEGIFTEVPSEAQNQFLRLYSENNKSFSSAQELWLSQVSKIMPLVIGWDEDPQNKKSVNYEKNARANMDPKDIVGIKAKEGPELYNDGHVIFVPIYQSFNDEEVKKLQKLDKAKKEYDVDKANENKKIVYNSALKDVQQFLSIDPETFVFEYDGDVSELQNPNDNNIDNEEKKKRREAIKKRAEEKQNSEKYIKAFYKFDPKLGSNQRKPRMVLKSSIIEKWNKDHKPILILNDKKMFFTKANPFDGYDKFASKTPMLKYAIPYRMPVDNVFKINQTYGDGKNIKVMVEINDKYPLKANDKLVLRYSLRKADNSSIRSSRSQLEIKLTDDNIKTRKFEFTINPDSKHSNVGKIAILSVSYDKKIDIYRGSEDKKWLYTFDEEDLSNKAVFDVKLENKSQESTTRA